MTKGRLSFTFSVWIWSQKVNTINHGAWRLICYWKFLRRLYLSMQTYLFAENTWEQLADLLQKSNPWPCIGPHNPEVDRMLAVHLLCKTLLAQFIFSFLSLVVTFCSLCEALWDELSLRALASHTSKWNCDEIQFNPPKSFWCPYSTPCSKIYHRCLSLHSWIHTYDMHCSYSGWKSWIVLDAWLEYDLGWRAL